MAADHDLLFGLFAFQKGFINQSQLLAAFHVWANEKSRSLASYLVERGDLGADARTAVEVLVSQELARKGVIVDQTVGDGPASQSMPESPGTLRDPQIEATLDHLGTAENPTEHDGQTHAGATADFSLGTDSAGGQRFRVVRPHHAADWARSLSRSMPS